MGENAAILNLETRFFCSSQMKRNLIVQAADGESLFTDRSTPSLRVRPGRIRWFWAGEF